MQTDWDLLIEKIQELRSDNDLSLRDIERKAKVSNLSRVLRKEDKDSIAPTPELWLKLHGAFPRYIPEPAYTTGEKVFKNVSPGHDQPATILSSVEKALIDMVRSTENPDKLCGELIAEIASNKPRQKRP